MIFKRLLAIFSSLLLTSCAQHLMQAPLVLETNAANTKLAEAAATTSHGLTDLNHLELANSPSLDNRLLINPNNFEMSTLASVDWAGPVGPIVARIATAANYRLRVLGNPPAMPVLIMLDEKDVPLGDLLRDIDYQAANRAMLKIFPDERVIELRYTSN